MRGGRRLKVSSQIPLADLAKSHQQNSLKSSGLKQTSKSNAITSLTVSSAPNQVSKTAKSVHKAIQLSQELIENGYKEVNKSMRSAKVRGAAIASAQDFYKNIPEIGMLNANSGPKNSVASVSIELSSIRRDSITTMNSMPVEINVQIADEIRAQISRNEWPTDKNTIDQRIKDISEAIVSGNHTLKQK